MFSRLGKLIKGFFSLFISNLETANPKALLEAEISSFQEAPAWNPGAWGFLSALVRTLTT